MSAFLAGITVAIISFTLFGLTPIIKGRKGILYVGYRWKIYKLVEVPETRR